MSQQAGQCGYCFGFCKNKCDGARRAREMMEGMFPPYSEIDALRRQLAAARKDCSVLREALLYCASIAGQEGAGRAVSSPYKAIESAARAALESVQ